MYTENVTKPTIKGEYKVRRIIITILPSLLLFYFHFFPLISSFKNHTAITHSNNNKISPLLFLPPYFLIPLSRPDPQSNALRAAFKGAGKVSSSSSPSTPSSPPALPWNTYAYP